jgi:hypothetical protein
MSNAIPPILVQIAADVSQLKAGLAQAQSSIKGMDSSVQTANTGMQNMLASAKKMAGTIGVAFAATQVVQFGKDVVMSASSMAESVSKVNVVFGESAEAVFKFGDAAAKNMGMSNQAAIEAAGTYGNLFQAFGIGQGKANEMSTTLVQLAADLGSFNNTSTEEAINALRSGLSGETEPLKRFGVAINETTLKAKALEMGFGAIKGAMDPAMKAQVTYALVMEQTKLAQGDYARTADGTANTMKTLSAQFADAKVAIGDILLPAFNALLSVFKVAIPILKSLADFVKRNKDLFGALAIGVGVAATAFVVYKAVIIASTIATKLFAVAQVIMKGGQLASIASTNTLAASMLKLNAAMRNNPIGLIVTGIALLIAGFVLAYKKSETFRNIVGTVAKAILTYVAFMIRAWGDMITTIMKVVTGPLRLFLTVMSKLPGVGGAAKSGLKMIDGAIEGVGDFAEKTALKIEGLKGKVDEFTKSANESAKAGKDKGGKGGKGGKGDKEDPPGLTAEQIATAKKRAEDIKKTLKDVAEVYKDMNKVIADSQERVAEATERRDEGIAKANKKYKEEIEKANKQFNETIAKEDKRLLEATAAAYKRNKEQLESINKDYAKRTTDIEEKLQETIANVRQKAADKSADLMQKAADKQQDIIQKSMDRLRNAFSSKTGFSLVDAFGKEGATGEQLLSSLTSQINASKNLAEKAAFLQANGFSQTFIEQVVSAGPEVGNELADSILNASPETIQALNASFIEMEKVSDHGLDALAKSMNTGANLATEELRTAYAEVAVDLKASLAEVNVEMTKSLAEANENYSKAMAEAKTIRDEKLAEAAKDLMESLAEADKNYKEAVAEAQKSLKEALAESAVNLTDALADVQKTYNEALDDIAKDTKEKIDALKEKLTELAATLKELGAKQAAIDILKNAPTYTPETGVIEKPVVVTPDVYARGGRIDSAGNYNAYNPEMALAMGGGRGAITVNQNISYPNASANDISDKTLSAIKFGTAVSP